MSDLPDLAQIAAADPAVSCFVTANAGSGKTRTLVNRVARLLLAGAPPDRILCLTYTKAAAAEMQRRLFQQLGDWAVASETRLRHDLALLEQRGTNDFTSGELSAARRLFARALETPGGLKIQTIHAFCERLIRRFPLETGVDPAFRVADETLAGTLAAEARAMVAAMAERDDDIAEAYARFAVALAFPDFERMFQIFEEKRSAIADYFGRLGDEGALQADALARCGLDREEDGGELEARALSPPALDVAAWRAAADALAASTSKTDGPRAIAAREIAEGAARGEPQIDLAWDLLFTIDGPRKNVATKAAGLETQGFLEREQTRLGLVFEAANAQRVVKDTVLALRLARAYGAAYDQVKSDERVLDFSDLTRKAAALLQHPEHAAWALFKLDGGVDHILVDEAQDTAPEQWEIIRAIAGEFFSGAGSAARAIPATLFVVGDEKQSIFSFQGAEPAQLETEHTYYARVVAEAGRRFSRIPLETSYRSVSEVLTYVDAAFSPEAYTRAIQPRPDARGAPANDNSLLVHHLASRTGQAGCIDLWSLDPETQAEMRRAWDAPPEVAERNANRVLADRIATEVVRLVREGDRIEWRDGTEVRSRPAGYGDVLILVRRRGALFKEVIRALKHRGAPVAGADRLALAETSVFEDLMALTRFALFPDDDLTLAGVLRGPLCEISEDDLHDLAVGRDGLGLWRTLRARRAERPVFDRAVTRLDAVIREARSRAPFEFFARLVAGLDEAGRSVRTRLRTRLGPEAEDALDEFLAQVLALEQAGARSLEHVRLALSQLTVTVKREMDAPRGEVRVMTTHGAKGLEAPIVFLPETVLGDPGRRSPLLETDDGAFLWSARKADDCTATTALKRRRKEKEDEEALRLLYVALTRARDRLVIGGRLPLNRKEENVESWWRPVRNAFDHPDIAPRVRDLILADGFPFKRFGETPKQGGPGGPGSDAAHPLPDWVRRQAPQEAAQRFAAPSQVTDDAGRSAANSPLATTHGLGRFRRGDIIHKLLQVLPDLAPDRRRATAERLLQREIGLTDEQRTEMAAAAMAVLNDPRFAPVFGPGSRAEAALAGTSPRLPPGMNVSGRMDRVVVSPDRVLVVDYKTNRPAPDRIEDCDPAYVTQMAVYAAVLAEVFPKRRIEAALVWTDGPKLMAVPENMMADALAALIRPG